MSKMQVNRLNKDELTYEVRIRGIAPGTVEEMRRSLAMARRLETSGDSVKYPEYPYSVEDDIKAVEEKLAELEPLVARFGDSSSSNSFYTYQTKLSHVLHRIDNMDEEKATQRPEYRAKALTLFSDLHRKAEEFEKLQSVPPQLSFLEQSSFEAAIEPVRRSSSTSPSRAGIKSILPNKWNLKFCGDKKGLSLSAFLEQVEELRLARHVSKNILLESGIDLFGGRAYQFYLAYRNQVSTWDDFVSLLREEYLSPNYNEKLFEEIRRRTQGSDESIGIYLAVMTGYFNRLTCSVSEETKLKILMRNIAPFYQNQLALVEVTSIAQLRDLGKRLEARKEAVENYVVPSRRSNTLEPDLAYIEVENQHLSEITTSQATGSAPVKREITCYRCGKPGHMAAGCIERRGKRKPTLLSDRGRRVDGFHSIDKVQVILDYVLENVVNDERPYLKIEIFGKPILGLLDSGASRTILGSKGIALIRELGLTIDRSITSFCAVANGSRVRSVGVVSLPVSLRGKFRLVEVIVVPELPHLLILGADFWRVMGIVPDLRHNEWYFSSEPVTVNAIGHVNSESLLTPLERSRLQALLDIEDGTQSSVTARNEHFKHMFSDVRKRLEVAAKKSCDQYNLRRRHVEYLPGQLVWKRNFVLSDAARYFSKKLAPKFIGPLKIKKRLSPWTYELMDDDGESKGVWHTKDLKPCPGIEDD
ncbi:hypothetical protein NQ317_014639 [Molorchus minor]|uniref:CCHC-type domain-containing protein n=1 Tax=Molorchus minor TaxID=1323400 RepID=A0ABQ9JQ00_9CUCU|nr:hypothetical protein NQ317_014639 [Molorchus minor]